MAVIERWPVYVGLVCTLYIAIGLNNLGVIERWPANSVIIIHCSYSAHNNYMYIYIRTYTYTNCS